MKKIEATWPPECPIVERPRRLAVDVCGGMLLASGRLSEADKDELRRQWEAAHVGLQWKGYAVMPPGWTARV